ncbi:MAG: PDZ domain-containing protein [Acidobacteria bacterium]|nr:PDZ domain-containing protein [Acidobacteriota bacterium]
MNTCSTCRAAVPEGSGFCNWCGQSLDTGQAGGARTATPPRAAANASDPFMSPHEWGAMTPSAGTSTLQSPDTAGLPRVARLASSARLNRWSSMIMVALLSLGAGVAGTQVYHLNFTPAEQVEIDGELHPEFTTVGGTKFQYADGAHVFETAPDSDVTRAGLQVGDVILRVDGQKIRYMESFAEILGNAPVGKPLEIIYIRAGKRAWTTLTPTTNWDEYTRPEGNQLPLQKANLLH